MNLNTALSILIVLFFSMSMIAQEDDLTAVELSMDQDAFADFLHDDPTAAYNYTTALRLGIYGEWANWDYLGLPWVRKKIDGFLIDRILDFSSYGFENESHNFVLTINGFSPTLISDQVPLFWDTLAAGFQLERDLPFSSFTGFRSTRRIELSKWLAHFGTQADLAITSSFTFGFASLGMVQGIDNMFRGDRPDANLWDRDEARRYPTGQLNHTMAPMFMYSVSMERVVWRPMKRVLMQVRPEVNLGYYTDVGIGLDFGKVMNTNRFIDNLSYTDTHNPGLASVSDKDVSWSLVGGGVVRGVLYNAHYHGYFGWNEGIEKPWAETRKYLLEAYVGLKLQFYQTLQLFHQYPKPPFCA